MISQWVRCLPASQAKRWSSMAATAQLPTATTPTLLATAARSISMKSSSVRPEGPDDNGDPFADGRQSVFLGDLCRGVVHQYVRGCPERFGDRSGDHHVETGHVQDLAKPSPPLGRRHGAYEIQV